MVFKKMAIMLHGQMENIKLTICNKPVDIIDVTNLLSRTEDMNG